MSIFTSGRNPDYFPQPDEFQPERWSRSHRDAESIRLANMGSIPFSKGARSCIGKKMAELVMHLFVAKVSTLTPSLMC